MKKYFIIIALLFLLPFYTFGQQKMGFENNNVIVYGKVELVDSVIGTGGSVTQSGTFTVHTFNSSGSFVPNDIKSVEILIVGAGGGSAGGGAGAGGGGGGEVVTNSAVAVTSSITVNVGIGVSGATGGSSSFGSITGTGGTAGTNNIGTGGTSGDGFAGGIGSTNSGVCTTTLNRQGGGGGGASTIGVNVADPIAGNGGDGIQSSISGIATFYGGGGGGGSERGTAGSGGQGGGADGGVGSGGASGNNGVANTGGGSGGAGGLCNVAGNNPVTGGSGIVIIRYTTPLNNLIFTDSSGTQTLAQLSAQLSPSGVVGAIQFSDGIGGVSSDGINLFWDDTNNRLGIGKSNPSQAIDVIGNIRVSGSYKTNIGISNNSSFNNAEVRTETTGVKIKRNVADANPTLVIEQVNASSTGDILQLKNSSGIQLSITQSGALQLKNGTTIVDGALTFDKTNEDLSIGDGSASQIVHMGAWKTWTPTFTGFSINPVVSAARYTQVGKMVSVYWSTNNGTSNATTFTINLPIAAANTARQFFSCAVATDNGAANTSPAMLRTTINSTTADIFKDSASAAWASIGGKKAQCSFTYESN